MVVATPQPNPPYHFLANGRGSRYNQTRNAPPSTIILFLHRGEHLLVVFNVTKVEGRRRSMNCAPLGFVHHRVLNPHLRHRRRRGAAPHESLRASSASRRGRRPKSMHNSCIDSLRAFFKRRTSQTSHAKSIFSSSSLPTSSFSQAIDDG